MAYDLDATETYTRSFRTPDGDCIIAMTGGFWNCLDWMDENSTWSASRLLKIAWSCAKQTENDGIMQNPDNFIAELTDAFKCAIKYRYDESNNENLGVANEN